MDKNSLPAEWKIEKLSIYVDTLESGSRPRGGVSKYTSGVPSISAEQILPDGNFYWDKTKYVPEPFYNSSTRGKIQKGDILIVKDGATTGKVAYIDKGFPHPKAMVNEHTFILRLKKNISTQWVYLFLRSHYLADFREKARQRGVIGGLTQGFLDELEIPVPPLPEQRRIVAKIEQLTSRLEKAKALQKQAVEEAETYLASTVSKVFDEGITKGWEIKKVKQICEKPQYGYTESATPIQVGPKFLRITDIQNGAVNWYTVPYCKCDELEKYRLSQGDILFARTGSVGKSYLVNDPPEAVFASYLIRLRATDKILPEFLFWYFQSSSYWHAVYSGTEDGNRPNMNGTKLAKLEIPFPRDKTYQKKIVKHFESAQAKVEQLKRLQAETESELEKFMPALLAKAFRGEL